MQVMLEELPGGRCRKKGSPRTEQESRQGGIQRTYTSLFDTIIRNTKPNIVFQASCKKVKSLV